MVLTRQQAKAASIASNAMDFNTDSASDDEYDIFGDEGTEGTDEMSDCRMSEASDVFCYLAKQVKAGRFPVWVELPTALVMSIFRFIGPGHYFYVALTCKVFQKCYKKASENDFNWRWSSTFYRNGSATISCAVHALSDERQQFIFSFEERLPIIAWAIRLGRKKILHFMYESEWFSHASANKCAETGNVEVICWMWTMRSFTTKEHFHYDDSLYDYFDREEFIIKLNLIKLHYDKTLMRKLNREEYSRNERVDIRDLPTQGWVPRRNIPDDWDSFMSQRAHTEIETRYNDFMELVDDNVATFFEFPYELTYN